MGQLFFIPFSSTAGAQGEQGIQGLQGITGLDGVGDLHFAFNQSSPSSIWIVNHNLGKFPSVTVLDSSGDQIEGTIRYVNFNQVTIEFSAPFSGLVYCN